MSFKTIYATGAIGLCLGFAPIAIHAQTADDNARDGRLFVPLVAECVDLPTADTCGKVRAVITECAQNFERDLCDVLFQEPDEVFDIAQMEEQAQTLLADTSDAIAEMEFEEVNNGAIEDIVEISRADAERTMLRGDENLMSHSGPPSVSDD